MKKKDEEIQKFLKNLNNTYAKLHTQYEENFWALYMGDHSVEKNFKKALEGKDAFCSNSMLSKKVNEYLKFTTGKLKERLGYWALFFSKYQIPEKVLKIKKEIDEVEAKIHKEMSSLKEGYFDPTSKKFVECSRLKMRTIMNTNLDEDLRKACFDALEDLDIKHIYDYVRLVALRNTFARELGYSDFYEYKLDVVEGMKKKDLFSIFDKIYEKTKYAFKDVKNMEKKLPGLRKPWNYGFMLSGDFTKEEDQYSPFDEVLPRWGKSFTALGIDYRGGTLGLDLCDRKGKHANGFCHYPDVVYEKDGKFLPGSANFTCNVVYKQIGSGANAYTTLFHEGGHAADRLNSTQSEIILNTEYPPASVAWAETHSMFLDSVYGSIEWKDRYAKNKEGESYPFSLYLKKVERVHNVSPLAMMSISSVVDFEKKIYESKNLTTEKVIEISKRTYDKYFNMSSGSNWILGVPHIYSWDSSCYYHGYGLAQLALSQWREYFYNKYGYIVDNPNVGKEMTKVWKLGSAKTFLEFVKIATGMKLSPDAFIRVVTAPLEKKIKIAQERIARLKKIKEYKGPINLNANIAMWHGKKKIADNRKSFEEMARVYASWLNKGGSLK